MSTHSVIAVAYPDHLEAVYCHWDGYLEHVGKILFSHYDREKAIKLVKLGYISSLDKDIGEKHDFDDSELGSTTFYGRDRGDDGCEKKRVNNIEELYSEFDEYFYYIMGTDGKWYFSNGHNFPILLSEALVNMKLLAKLG